MNRVLLMLVGVTALASVSASSPAVNKITKVCDSRMIVERKSCDL